jgi:hypothetical protein
VAVGAATLVLDFGLERDGLGHAWFTSVARLACAVHVLHFVFLQFTHGWFPWLPIDLYATHAGTSAKQNCAMASPPKIRLSFVQACVKFVSNDNGGAFH